MKHLVTIIVLCFAVGQSIPSHAQDGKVASQIEIPTDAIDQVCKIVLKSSKSASTETDAGKILRFDDSKVVLVDATRTVRVDKSVPFLGAIPYLSRMFRNIGIGVEKLPGELTINRSEIRSIKFEK
jgi:hypothetical protein